jgi:probable HAF family extracellular repeat protein
MLRKTISRPQAIVATLLCIAAVPAVAGSYTYTSLAPAGSIQPTVGGMNESDQVVGSFQDPTTYVSHGFLWSNGSFTQIDVGTYGTFLNAINASGVAAGYYYASAADAKNFKYTPMTYDTVHNTHTDVPFRGKYSKDSAAALGINDQGIVIGSAFVGPDSSAFFRNARRTGFVNVPNAPYVTVGVAINNRNEALLSGIDLSYNEYSYVARGGKFTLLAPPGGVSVNGWGCGSNSGFISPTGVVGGSYGVSTGVNGFILSNGRYKTFSYPGQPIQTTVSGVSATGVVAGCYLDASAGYATKGFVNISRVYYPILVPGSSTTSIVAINAKGSLIGQYASSSVSGVFIAQCPADQAPCTK